MLHPNYRFSCETSQVSSHITGFSYITFGTHTTGYNLILSYYKFLKPLHEWKHIPQRFDRIYSSHSMILILKHDCSSALAVLSATLSSKTFVSQSKTLISLKIIFILNNVIVASESIADKCTWQTFHSLKIKTFY